MMSCKTAKNQHVNKIRNLILGGNLTCNLNHFAVRHFWNIHQFKKILLGMELSLFSFFCVSTLEGTFICPLNIPSCRSPIFLFVLRLFSFLILLFFHKGSQGQAAHVCGCATMVQISHHSILAAFCTFQVQ